MLDDGTETGDEIREIRQIYKMGRKNGFDIELKHLNNVCNGIGEYVCMYVFMNNRKQKK